ncbi:hypothetical protein DL89DRAFT_295984 [Linderina pennispora]|uniref:Protein YAE1 n=1 Tax=Linderina pennispora TaxID=61395 RepID=A0A1Y1VWS8_9FUNG|nr:uncharacterized protein DL89DRAFT_295984 [Linderina pennispora]ORX65749.1 hypothetical protein DL89DRAFT_295984 [Linderina pennispora]
MNNNAVDDVWDLDQDDFESERVVAAQSLGKLQLAFGNAGYKYGIDASKTDHMQEGFDKGFELSIEKGRIIGSLLGKLLARRDICKRLDLPVENIDSVVMRLRAIKHTTAFSAKALRGEDDKTTTDTFDELVKDAHAVLDTMCVV